MHGKDEQKDYKSPFLTFNLRSQTSDDYLVLQSRGMEAALIKMLIQICYHSQIDSRYFLFESHTASLIKEKHEKIDQTYKQTD